MKKILSSAERLIVAADFKPDKSDSEAMRKPWIKKRLSYMAHCLQGTGVYVKINSVLRILGYEAIELIHDEGLKVFADLKLNDISETLRIDGMLLKYFKPDILTVMCSTGIDAMKALKDALPDTEILGVTVLTSLSNNDCLAIYGKYPIEPAVLKLAGLAESAGIDGFVASARDALMLKNLVSKSMTVNCPGTRPAWTKVEGDDQNQSRVMTPYDAIIAKADRIIVGRPIIQHPNPAEAVRLTLGEIDKACNDLEKKQ